LNNSLCALFDLDREVDSALRPGAYALLDACSTNDLQQLHAVFGGMPLMGPSHILESLS